MMIVLAQREVNRWAGASVVVDALVQPQSTLYFSIHYRKALVALARAHSVRVPVRAGSGPVSAVQHNGRGRLCALFCATPRQGYRRGVDDCSLRARALRNGSWLCVRVPDGRTGEGSTHRVGAVTRLLRIGHVVSVGVCVNRADQWCVHG